MYWKLLRYFFNVESMWNSNREPEHCLVDLLYLNRIRWLLQVQYLVWYDDIKPFYVSRGKKGDKRPIFPHQKTHIKILPDIFLRWPLDVCAFDFSSNKCSLRWLWWLIRNITKRKIIQFLYFAGKLAHYEAPFLRTHYLILSWLPPAMIFL